MTPLLHFRVHSRFEILKASAPRAARPILIKERLLHPLLLPLESSSLESYLHDCIRDRVI